MKNTKLLIYILAILSLSGFQSCIEGANELKNWIDAKNIDEVQGKYHRLSEDGIKLYLPSVFKKYPFIAYQKLVDSLANTKDAKIEKKRLNILRKMDGNLSIFFDENTGSTFTLNTIPYAPLYKKDAQYLLGMIRKSYEMNNIDNDIAFEKTTAKYSSKSGTQMFKAVYRIEDTKTKDFSFNSTYIISSNKKTIWIQIRSPYETGMDDYITKIIM